MSNAEKATSTCYLENYRLLRLDYENKVVYNQKTTSRKFNGLHRMYESSRKSKSYIIMQSRKLLSFEHDSEDNCCLQPNKTLLEKKNTVRHRMCDSSRKSYIIMLSRALLNCET